MALAESGTVSERHAAARKSEKKLTAGEMAAAMRKAGYEVTAADLKPFAPEWHHAGFRPGGKGMGRCFFFPVEDATPAGMERLADRVAKAKAAASLTRYGWVVAFRRERGAYGRTRWQPIAEVREFAPGQKLPEKYTEITPEEYAALAPHNGAELEPHESRASFLARISA